MIEKTLHVFVNSASCYDMFCNKLHLVSRVDNMTINDENKIKKKKLYFPFHLGERLRVARTVSFERVRSHQRHTRQSLQDHRLSVRHKSFFRDV